MKKICLIIFAAFFTTAVFSQEVQMQNHNEGNSALANFEAVKKGSAVQVSWTALNETSLVTHEIQKSANGTSFTNIGTLVAQNSPAPYSYVFLDAAPVDGYNYYRLRTTDSKGNVTFSKIAGINNGVGRTDINVLPNPVRGGVLNMQLININSAKYIISIYSSGGQKVFTRSLDITQGSTTETINLPQDLAHGLYFLQLTNGEMRINKQIILQ